MNSAIDTTPANIGAARIVALDTLDVRFPTSRELDGSDAMNPDPDYSAACVTLRTDQPGLAGYGFVFTIGRGNDVQKAALDALAERVIGLSVEAIARHVGYAEPSTLRRLIRRDTRQSPGYFRPQPERAARTLSRPVEPP